MWGGRSGGTSSTGCATRTPPTPSCKMFCPHSSPLTIKPLIRFGTTTTFLSCTARLAHWPCDMPMYCGMYICMYVHNVIARWQCSTLYIQHVAWWFDRTAYMALKRMHSVSALWMYTCIFSAASNAWSQVYIRVDRPFLAAAERQLYCADCHVCLGWRHHQYCSVDI